MEKPKRNEPTFPTPILVGSGHHHVDLQGTRFETFPAFERFFEHCRKDFDKIRADLVVENRQEPKPGDI